MKHLFILISLLTWSCPSVVWPQSLVIDSRHNPQMSLCENEVFRYHLQNPGVQLLQGVQLAVTLPEGMLYVAGSQDMMTEVDISDLQSPVFVIQDLLPGSGYIISFTAHSSCEMYTEIQAGREYENELQFIGGGIDLTYHSEKYSLNPAHLVLTNAPSVLAETNTTFTRTVSISNGRLGRIQSFIFEDHHDAVRMGTNMGTLLDSTDVLLRIRLDSQDFKQIGNGDAYFDLNERIDIVEKVRHEKCEDEILSSEVQVYWGCNNAICQGDTAFSDLIMTATTGSANIQTEAQPSFPDCPCLPDGYTQCIVIENRGDAVTENLVFDLNISSPTSTVFGGIEGSERIDSGNARILNITYDSVRALVCQSTGRVFGKARVFLTDLEPGQKIKLCFNILPCFPSYPANGDEVEFNWSYGYEYATACKPFSFRRRRGINVEMLEKSIDVKIEVGGLEKGEDWVSGKPYDHRWKIFGPSLLDTGRLKVEICLPCGIMALDSISLSSPEELLLSETISNDTSTYIVNWYRLPFSSDTAFASIPIGLDCQANCVKALGVPQNTSFITSCEDPAEVHMEYASLICSGTLVSKCPDSLDCGFLSEGFASATLDCPEYDTVLTIKAYVESYADIQRVSFGQPDADNDRFADGGLLDTSVLKLKRCVLGDTLLASFKGEIVIDSTTVLLDSLDFALVSKLPLEFVRAEVGFRSKDGSTEWWCDYKDAAFIKKEGLGPGCCQTVVQRNGEVALHVEVTEESLDAQGCAIPDFRLEHGDSVFCRIWVTNPIHTARIIGNTVVQYIGAYDRSEVPIIPFTCGPIGTRLEYSGLILNIFPYEILDLDVCGRHGLSGGWKVYSSEISDNFFPFEFRQLMTFDSLKISVPDQFVVDSIEVMVNYRELFANTDTFTHTLPMVFDGQAYIVPARDLASLSYDEGAYYLIRPYVRLRDCSIGPTGGTPMAELAIGIGSVGTFKFGVVPIVNTAVSSTFEEIEKEIFIDYPEVELDIGSREISAQSRQYCKRIHVQVSEQVDYLAWHAALRNDLQAEFELKESGGLAITSPSNGTFISHDVAQGVYAFDLCVNSTSCLEDSLSLGLNWACRIESVVTETCFDTSFVFQVSKESAEIDLDIDDSQMTVDLCDTTGWWTVEIFNGDLGRAYDLELFVSLPDGLLILEGEHQILYPLTGNWRAIPRAQGAGANTYKWNISALLGATDPGLPGIDSLALNRLGLRFKLLTDCDLDQGRVVTYWIRGTNPCGSNTNQVRKSTRPILINGLGTSFQSTVDMEVEHDQCESTIGLEVTIESNGVTTGQEVIEIEIPEGLRYVVGSMKAIRNIDFQIPGEVVSNGQRILTFVPQMNIPANETIIFHIGLEDWRELPCESWDITATMLSPDQVLCQQTGEPCQTSIVNGQDNEFLEKDGTHIEFDSIYLFDSLVTTFAKFRLKVLQGSSGQLDSLFVSIYKDVDNNDSLTATDQLLEKTSHRIMIDSSSMLEMCVPFQRFGLCNWIVTLNGPCFCRGDTFILTEPRLVEHYFSDTLCPGDSLLIGEALDKDAIFSWRSTEMVCDTCSYQVFYASERPDSITNHIYQLHIRSTDGCEVNYYYDINVLPEGQDFLDTFLICPGDTITLKARIPGIWTGPGINGFEGQEILISPSSDASYLVNFHNDTTCGGSHQFVVVVFDQERFVINADSVVEKGDTIQLEVLPPPNWIEWKEAVGLSCRDCPDPSFVADSSVTLCAEVLDSNGCPQILTFAIIVTEPDCDDAHIFIPNAFSPNGDGSNDTWRVMGEIIDELQVVVYDRWGEMVFETDDPMAHWDGSYGGTFLGPDVYAYWVRVVCFNGMVYEQKGNVSLIR